MLSEVTSRSSVFLEQNLSTLKASMGVVSLEWPSGSASRPPHQPQAGPSSIQSLPEPDAGSPTPPNTASTLASSLEKPLPVTLTSQKSQQHFAAGPIPS